MTAERRDVPRDEDGKIRPTLEAMEKAERDHPSASPAERYRIAQSITLVDWFHDWTAST